MRIIFIIALALTVAREVKAHNGGAVPNDVWIHWNFDPVLFSGLLLPVYLYRRGSATYRVGHWRTTSFFGGIITLAVALVSPLDAMSHSLFSAHMTQHLLLILLAAPLLTLSQPLAPLLRGLPLRWRKTLGVIVQQSQIQTWEHRLTHPFSTLIVHVVALWLWHVPGLYDLALNNPGIHALEHASFFITAILFWSMIYRKRDYGGRVLAVFILMMASSLLGGLMTFSRAPWYATHADSVQLWGMTALADQHLAGLVMWIPMGMVYVVTAAVLLAAWLHAVDQRVAERERKLLEEVYDA